MLTAAEIIRRLGLEPLPGEGGYYRETYRSTIVLAPAALPAAYPAARPAGTAIYYLITPDFHSALHRLQGDEVWHFYLGDPAEQIQLRPDGSAGILRLGQDLEGGCVPQVVAPGGAWQSTRLVPGGAFALFGTTMAPGFDFSEYEAADAPALARQYPLLNDWLNPPAGRS